MKSAWPRRILYLALAAAVAAGAWWSLKERPAEVDVVVLREGSMEVVIRQDGRTRVRDIYSVSTPIAGHLSRTLLREGDRVEAGKTMIAEIHPLDPPLIDTRTQSELIAAREAARSGVAMAQSELQRVETVLELAREERERAQRLFSRGVIAKSVMDDADAATRVQEAAVDAARGMVTFRQAELASAEARLMQPTGTSASPSGCCVSIVSPVDGTVLSIKTRDEQAVPAGVTIAEIGDTSRLEVVADLISADAVRVTPGTSVRIVGWGGDAALPATVRTIDPAAFTKVSALGIEEQRVNAVLDLDRGDPRLGHGFRVVAEIPIWSCANCLQVPISALFRFGDAWRVFVLGNDRLTERTVQIGQMNDDVAEVMDGLAVGETVVIHPSDTLEDGALATIRE